MRRVEKASKNLITLSKWMNFRASCRCIELLYDKKAQFVDKSDCCCNLCNVKIKKGKVEICVDCQDVTCNNCVKHCCDCEKTTKCRDYMMVDINDPDASVWKCDECSYFAAQHEEETEERGGY
eukprot:2011981-Ditylum_brightwellii.AAC.1